MLKEEKVYAWPNDPMAVEKIIQCECVWTTSLHISVVLPIGHWGREFQKIEIYSAE